MIFTKKPKKIRVMFTPFRDGLQSSFGGKVRLKDILPAMEASAAAGIRHFEFGGARAIRRHTCTWVRIPSDARTRCARPSARMPTCRS